MINLKNILLESLESEIKRLEKVAKSHGLKKLSDSEAKKAEPYYYRDPSFVVAYGTKKNENGEPFYIYVFNLHNVAWFDGSSSGVDDITDWSRKDSWW